jgi:hypothetical protein
MDQILYEECSENMLQILHKGSWAPPNRVTSRLHSWGLRGGLDYGNLFSTFVCMLRLDSSSEEGNEFGKSVVTVSASRPNSNLHEAP